MRDDAGSASLVVVLLLPMLVLAFAGAVDLGLLRLAAARARAAADLAAVIAVNDQSEPAPGGGLRLAADAERVAREYLAANLEPVGPLLARDARGIASDADVAVFPEGGVDPADGRHYDRPTVRIDARVPLRTGALHPFVGATVPVRAFAAAAAR